MKNKERIYAIVAVLSFVAMTASLVLASMNAGEAGLGLRELGPAFACGFVFLVSVVLAKQNRRR
ncbi:hypothetical protein [Eggerthella sinensis]|jgi:hypothetical protein|uniref:Uncharacterized protein n=1 Tax=Eggerthella sinensis TaxID=242230 RepID=A0A3N0ITL9_9ACTN|nr:hypothetical protein [Eggerthella sinensis]MCB7038820.1 hypothetical protein [Eggerthella sinensis]RDB66611.1 hypothetical protein C1876_14515 [Eggerthella sinensis]RNM40351.1 hypothetical protein DMP09_14760 [Eggerthella sinensis]